MYKRNISWEPVLHKNYKGMYNRNISWEPVLHKNYKRMYKRNISWEPVLHNSMYKRNISFIGFMKYWFPGDISLIHRKVIIEL
jgi:hypothetical protein